MNRTLMNVLASALLAGIAISARAQNASAPQASLASAGAQQGTSSAIRPAAAAGAQLGQGARSSESDELANLQKQIPLWKARAEIAKYQAEVRKSEPAVGLAAPLPAATMAAAQGPSPQLHRPHPRLLQGRARFRCTPTTASTPRWWK